MKNIILASALCSTLAQSPVDLGYIGPNKGIWLESNSPGFKHFTIELLAGTNLTIIVKTNELLTLGEFPHVPAGPIIMGIKSTHTDGIESPLSLYNFTLIKDVPHAPVAKVTFVSSEVVNYGTNNLVSVLNQIKKSRVIPLPPSLWPTNIHTKWDTTDIITNHFPKPLPSAMDEYYNRSRRN